MPVTIHAPEPCAPQRTLMESLGFSLDDGGSENGAYCRWAIQVRGDLEIFRVDLPPKHEPKSLQFMVEWIIEIAFHAGQTQHRNALRALL